MSSDESAGRPREQAFFAGEDGSQSLGDASEALEKITTSLLSALEESMPGPRQRAAARAREELSSLAATLRPDRPDVAGAASGLSRILEEVASGGRPADDAHVDLALRTAAAISRLLGAAPARREVERDRLEAVLAEAGELAWDGGEAEDDPGEDAAELRAVFVEEARGHIDRLTAALSRLHVAPEDEEAVAVICRSTHTLKGAAGTVGAMEVVNEAHALEDLFMTTGSRPGRVDDDVLRSASRGLGGIRLQVDRLAFARDAGEKEMALLEAEAETSAWKASPAPTLRVRADQLDAVHLDAGELTASRAKAIEAAARLQRLGRRARRRRADMTARFDAFVSEHTHPLPMRAPLGEADRRRRELRRRHEAMACAGEIAELDGELSQALESLLEQARRLTEEMEIMGNLAAGMREKVSEMRFVPIFDVLEKYAPPAREWALEAGRRAVIDVEAQGVQVDRAVAEALSAPVVQLLRNAVVHGLEEPAERSVAGKPEMGRVVLRAMRDGPDLILEVEDDGRGLEPSTLRRAAVERGFLSDHEVLDLPEARLADLVFLPGFSTSCSADTLSGRGFGLDVVATTVARLGGVVSVSSEPGRGTRFSARMPPTSATLAVLGLKCGRNALALPLAAVRETLLLDGSAKDVDESGHLSWQGREHRAIRLSEVVGAAPGPESAGRTHGVLIGHEGRHAILVVDGLLGREEGLLRPLGAMLDCLPLYAGAVVGADGRLKLVLDASYLLSTAFGLRPAARAYSRSR